MLKEPYRNRLRRRAGFTLLEIILATSISLVLLAALYTALKLHLRVAQQGPEGARKAQTARAVLERVARDVRATIPPAPASQSAGTASGSSAATSSGTPSASNSSSGSSSASSTDSDPYRAAVGVAGGRDWIELYVAEDRANLDDDELAALGGSPVQASNVLRVRYQLTSITTRPDAKGRTVRWGLTRSEVAAIGAERLDASSGEADYRATTEFLCDDVGELTFQYWDDSTGAWVDSWGGDAAGAPRAVKVFISLLEADEYQSDKLGLAGGQTTWTPNFQLVIAIPSWTPNDSSSASTTGKASGTGSTGSTSPARSRPGAR